MSLAASSKLTRDNVVSILKFIRYLGEHFISSEKLIIKLKQGRWVRTSKGDMIPSNSVLSSCEWNAASEISDIPFIDEDYYGRDVLSFKEELKLLGVLVDFNKSCYQLVSDNLKSSSSLISLSSEAMLLILKCIQNLESPNKMVSAIQNKKCLKTSLGFKYPSECFLVTSKTEWGCLLLVFGSFSILDENFYGSSIFPLKRELKNIGVNVDFQKAAKEFTRTFEQHASTSSVTKENVFMLLECLKKFNKMELKVPKELKDCLRKEKWLKTKIGDYRAPNECILFGTEWEPISQITILPFIDDSDNFYGSRIREYQAELKWLGVITEYKDGAKFVAARLCLPESSSSITPANVYALLDCVKILKETKAEIHANFFGKLSQKDCLKTYMGYQSSNNCMLFSPDWEPFLERSDGPFIDEDFYESRIGSYKEELKVLGVVTDIKDGCDLIASYLDCHSNFECINRIYSYLCKFKWDPEDEDDKMIWIPRGSNNGEWVTPKDCVLHDKNNLFSGQLNVLEKFRYDKKILNFFADVFDVNGHPSVDDYCSLWKKWESSENQITHTECCAFWDFVVKSWNPKTEETFKKSLSKLPVSSSPHSTDGGIYLSDKRDVFIGDDLFLMDLFQSCSSPIFVWYPQPSSKTLTRIKLVDVYKKLGVRTISESAEKNVSDVDHVKFDPINSKEKIIKKGLVKLILGFLADPVFKLDIVRRHEAVSRILEIKAFETAEPMTVKYSLSLSSGDVVEVEAKRMIRWDKQNSRLYMQKLERKCCGYKNVLEYASHFGEVIAEGVLWENEEVVPQLSELIKLGSLVEFDEEAVDFLMKTKNLQIFPEDHDYISSIFSC